MIFVRQRIEKTSHSLANILNTESYLEKNMSFGSLIYFLFGFILFSILGCSSNPENNGLKSAKGEVLSIMNDSSKFGWAAKEKALPMSLKTGVSIL